MYANDKSTLIANASRTFAQSITFTGNKVDAPFGPASVSVVILHILSGKNARTLDYYSSTILEATGKKRSPACVRRLLKDLSALSKISAAVVPTVDGDYVFGSVL